MGFGQMAASLLVVEANAKAATEALDELATSAAVPSVSKALGTILDRADNDPARALVDRYNELIVMLKSTKNVTQKQQINESIRLTADYFRKLFGPELGSIKSLAKELRDYADAMATTADAKPGATSGTIGKKTIASGSAGINALSVLKWSGGLR